MRATRSRPWRNDQGSATVIVVTIALAGWTVAALWIGVARAGIARQRAETAADLAALSAAHALTPMSGGGVAEACAGAARVAAQNDAVLLSCHIRPASAIAADPGGAGGGGEIADVMVSVERPVAATAAARAGPVSP